MFWECSINGVTLGNQMQDEAMHRITCAHETMTDVDGSFHVTYKITASTGEGVEAKSFVLAFTQEQWRAMALRMLEMTGYVEHLKERCLAQNDEEQDAW